MSLASTAHMHVSTPRALLALCALVDTRGDGRCEPHALLRGRHLRAILDAFRVWPRPSRLDLPSSNVVETPSSSAKTLGILHPHAHGTLGILFAEALFVVRAALVPTALGSMNQTVGRPHRLYYAMQSRLKIQCTAPGCSLSVYPEGSRRRRHRGPEPAKSGRQVDGG
jgi:hypothetical protein